jgi:hypothetical protein
MYLAALLLSATVVSLTATLCNSIVHCGNSIKRITVAFKQQVMKSTYRLALALIKTNLAKAGIKMFLNSPT